MHRVSDINVTATTELPSPVQLRAEIQKTPEQRAVVAESREAIHRIIFGDDKRLLIVIGPCSIHDPEAGMEYARRLKSLADRVSDRMLLVMRVYFEKPRTTTGWKGLVMDPFLDGSYNISEGLRIGRKLLGDVVSLGLPTATELLDPITPQYIADLICWSAIGARTAESQTHRQMASGLSMPLGFKNGTGGNIDLAINGVKAASQPQTFLGITQEGKAASVTTRGNPNCHIILRGGSNGPNYQAEYVSTARELLDREGLIPALMVDCSHANSSKDPSRQPEVFRDVVGQILAGEDSIIGAMIESNLVAGNQKFPQPIKELTYGQSITDGCIDWETTEALLLEIHQALAPRFEAPASKAWDID